MARDYDLGNSILSQKRLYDEAYNKRDKKGMENAANGAKAYYDELSRINSGMATGLKNSNSSDAKKLLDSFKGSLNGSTYETQMANTAGATNASQQYDADSFKKWNDNLFNKSNEGFDYAKNYDPYSSNVGKSILSQYDSLGFKASDGAMADGASENSGNIDSFALANAKKQQLDFKNAGVTAVSNDFQNRVSSLSNMLNSMGIQTRYMGDKADAGLNRMADNAQRAFDNDFDTTNAQRDYELNKAQMSLEEKGMANSASIARIKASNSGSGGGKGVAGDYGSLLASIANGTIKEDYLKANMADLINMYTESKYNTMVKNAEEYALKHPETPKEPAVEKKQSAWDKLWNGDNNGDKSTETKNISGTSANNAVPTVPNQGETNYTKYEYPKLPNNIIALFNKYDSKKLDMKLDYKGLRDLIESDTEKGNITLDEAVALYTKYGYK